jgi:hypothetical protein
MRFTGILGIGFLFILSVLARLPAVSADVTPGDVIDKTNWQKAEGLLPDPLLNWVRKGDFILNIAELAYDPKEFITPAYKQSLEDNVGKYALNEEDVIIDAKTGKAPGFIVGIPFPGVDLDDPRAGTKLMHNRGYYWAQKGNASVRNEAIWVGEGGYEREISNELMILYLDGYPAAKSYRNPDGFLKKSVIAVDYPYDVSGFSILSWRYRDKRADVTVAYVPAIRRVRRMSPANRSDSFLGSDFCVDDPNGYDGKVELVAWKVIGQRETLVPFRDTKPQRMVENKRGELVTTSDIAPLVHGYEAEGWQGAPWALVSTVWVKRNLILIEGIAKDPYYNYGKMIIWYDREFHIPKYKVIHDRAGDYWKTMLISNGGYETPDKTGLYMSPDLQFVVDDRTRHASLIRGASEKNIWRYKVDLDTADFTLAGFQKYCK